MKGKERGEREGSRREWEEGGGEGEEGKEEEGNVCPRPPPPRHSLDLSGARAFPGLAGPGAGDPGGDVVPLPERSWSRRVGAAPGVRMVLAPSAAWTSNASLAWNLSQSITRVLIKALRASVSPSPGGAFPSRDSSRGRTGRAPSPLGGKTPALLTLTP